GEGEHRGGHRGCTDQRTRPARSRCLEEGLEEVLLADEAEEGRDACHGQRGQGGDGGGQGHAVAQATESAKIPGAVLVIDQSDDHEECGLEQGVGQGVDGGGHERCAGTHADDGDQQTELADGGVGGQRLHVVLLEGEQGAQERGDQTEGDQDQVPQDQVTEGGGEAHGQVDACFDHGCGV